MELFFSDNIDGHLCRLDKEESGHCIRVLRHRKGDEISIIDGLGTKYLCKISKDDPSAAEAIITGIEKNWGSHPYHLHLAVCPTKNADRYEWMMEKATEIGVDVISPIIGEHSERKIFKTDRAKKILLSATKQSLKGAVPSINEASSVRNFIIENGTGNMDGCLKLIAYCFDGEDMERTSIKEILNKSHDHEIMIMIGPEGDFSKEEAHLAIDNGFIPIHLGESRLRTETAGLTACEAVYLHFMK